LVDEKALLKALETGRISGAALDCFETEPYNGPLVELDQVVLTAHMGSYAQEARQMMEIEAAENLLQGLLIKGLIV
jgi:D-3-phosphoglycerate dehydrogenase